MTFLRLRQVCLVAEHLSPVEAQLREVLGLVPCHREPTLERFGLKNVVLPLGKIFIEVVAPIAKGTAAGRFLQQRGGRGGYMLIFDCDDPLRYQARAKSLGIRVAHTTERGAYLGVQLHPRDTEGTFLEFNRTLDGESLDGPYHPAGPDWQRYVSTEVCRDLRAAVIESGYPARIAQRWSALFDLPLKAGGSEAPLVMPVDTACIRFAPHSGEESLLSELEIEVNDPDATMQRASRNGCLLGSKGFRLGGVDFKVVPGP